MAKEKYNVLSSLSPLGGIVILEEAQSFGSPSDPLVLKIFNKDFHILFTGHGAQVVGGTSPGCAAEAFVDTWHRIGIRTWRWSSYSDRECRHDGTHQQ